MSAFTIFHVLLSLIAIASGLIALMGWLISRWFGRANFTFLITTVATSVTGFFFPYHGVTPGIVLGILSVVVLIVALIAAYAFHLRGGWRKAYVITAALALYFNVFVLIVQSFEKVPALKTLAPTATETPFKVVQLVTLLVFIILTLLAMLLFRGPARRIA